MMRDIKRKEEAKKKVKEIEKKETPLSKLEKKIFKKLPTPLQKTILKIGELEKKPITPMILKGAEKFIAKPIKPYVPEKISIPVITGVPAGKIKIPVREPLYKPAPKVFTKILDFYILFERFQEKQNFGILQIF